MVQLNQLYIRVLFLMALPMLARAEQATAESMSPYAEEETASGFLIIGAAASPEFAGSADYTPVPFIVSEYSRGPIQLGIEGLSLQAMKNASSRWMAGLIVELDPGRDSSVANADVARMDKIGFAINTGPALRYQRENIWLGGDQFELQLAALRDASGVHDGHYARATGTYAMPLMIPWRVEFELEASYADSNYTARYFGVSAADSAKSGLQPYQAQHGPNLVSASTNIGFFFSPEWGIFSRLSVGHLLDDASRSPVTRSGDKYQYFAGVGVYRRF